GPARHLLAPGALAGQAAPAASPQVCTCFDVRQDRIEALLPGLSGAPQERLAALQAQTRCGTNCGSCLPTLRRLIDVPARSAVPAPGVSA
ncbi:MAG TPA: (2Fe-2S)-binding protein, partial [Burkholderiaceae bacterium]|nr:(2Fe-2S)-binding protein [Burkholderiaceae bacterium]